MTSITKCYVLSVLLPVYYFCFEKSVLPRAKTQIYKCLGIFRKLDNINKYLGFFCLKFYDLVALKGSHGSLFSINYLFPPWIIYLVSVVCHYWTRSFSPFLIWCTSMLSDVQVFGVICINQFIFGTKLISRHIRNIFQEI